MADQYASVFGTVQEFPDKPVVGERELNNQTIREFTIKSTTSGKLVRITVWPEHDAFTLVKGQGVLVDGKYSVNESKGKTYYGVSATALTILPAPLGRSGREVVNQPTDDDNDAVAPF